MSVHAYVSLKQPDLHAISALASLKSLLGDDAPTHLFRCRHLVFDQKNIADFSDISFAPLLAKRFDVVNPNKEQVCWNHPPAVSLASEHTLFWVDVLACHPNPPETLVFSDGMVSMSVRVTWGIVLQSRGLSREALQKHLSDTILFGRSVAAGLLVNPVLETAQFL
jgi:hypothetical protein